MKSTASSFVELKRLFIEYPDKQSGLSSIFGRKGTQHSVLRDISFTLEQGEWITLFGESGSGKSTLLRTLVGSIVPSSGSVVVNGKSPVTYKGLAAGYVSSEETEPAKETVNAVLHAYGRTHDIKNLPARIGAIAEMLGIKGLLQRSATRLSTSERLYVNIARAALSDAPLILLDDIADHLGVAVVKNIIRELFSGRTVIVATRFHATAEALDFPLMLLHNGHLAHYGTCSDIATTLGCNRTVDVWVEGLRYDLLRKIRAHKGVLEVRLLPTDQFDGQHLRIVVRSSRYLPSLYDLVSQSPLIKIDELPPSLADIMSRL